jgi:hypothetical protein
MALRKYDDESITKAGHKLMETWTNKRLPSPADLILEIPRGDESTAGMAFTIEPGRKCKTCGHFGLCIDEPAGMGHFECRRCYTGLSNDEIKIRFRELGIRQ